MGDEKKFEDALAKTMDVIIHPDSESLADLANISPGMMSELISLKSYFDKLPSLFAQIRARQEWCIKEFVHRQARVEAYKNNLAKITFEKAQEKTGGKKVWEEPKVVWTQSYQDSEIVRLIKLLDNDVVDTSRMFANRVLEAYYHHSRGKDHLTLDKVTMLKDTELQVRNTETESDSAPIRTHV